MLLVTSGGQVCEMTAEEEAIPVGMGDVEGLGIPRKRRAFEWDSWHGAADRTRGQRAGEERVVQGYVGQNFESPLAQPDRPSRFTGK